jgi:hypothetical protein
MQLVCSNQILSLLVPVVWVQRLKPIHHKVGERDRPHDQKLTVDSFDTRDHKMQKFALKMLLTNMVLKRRSKRVDGAQFVASLLTLVAIVSVGLYIWAHGPY